MKVSFYDKKLEKCLFETDGQLPKKGDIVYHNDYDVRPLGHTKYRVVDAYYSVTTQKINIDAVRDRLTKTATGQERLAEAEKLVEDLTGFHVYGFDLNGKGLEFKTSVQQGEVYLETA